MISRGSFKPFNVSKEALKHGYRSGFEMKTMEWLKAKGVDVEFETEILEFTKPETVHKYHPDFIITNLKGKKIYIETKGRFLLEDRKKQLAIRACHPDKDIRMVFQYPNTKTSKGAKGSYGDWCEKNNVPYSKLNGKIPEEWLTEED